MDDEKYVKLIKKYPMNNAQIILQSNSLSATRPPPSLSLSLSLSLFLSWETLTCRMLKNCFRRSSGVHTVRN